MVPTSDEPLFTARVEPQPRHFNSSPKLICTMWQYVLIPIELLLGSAEDGEGRPSAGRLLRPSETMYFGIQMEAV